MSAPLSPGAWAKLHAGQVLPLADHAGDVAAVFEALLAAGWRDGLGRAQGRALSAAEVQALCALAFLHDLGKANRGFWLRQNEGAKRVGHLREVIALWEGVPARVCATLEALGVTGLYAMLAHHGRPVGPDSACRDGEWIWQPGESYNPIAALESLLAMAQALYPLAFAGTGATDALAPRVISLFAGLLTLADWIGSDPEQFPLDGVSGEERATRSAAAAQARVTGLGLGGAQALRAVMGEPVFGPIFGVSAPREAQALAGDADLGRLTILEAETGSGKTEAALWRFLRLLEQGAVESLYFALPTRTSAVQIKRRVDAMLEAAFGAGRLEATLAVPGYLEAGTRRGERLGRFETLWPDRPRDALEDACWAAESPKRFLAARIAVGTIDQVLMAGLQRRHAHLRAACLSRALLVVDEVHASDDYMSTVLRQVLANHLGAGGHAMLLSATLGSAARAGLLKPQGGDAPLALEAALATPYPALHGDAAGTRHVSTDGRAKSIRIETRPDMADAEEVARAALEAAQAGARVLVLRNTVKAARATLEALEALPGAEPYLFRVAGMSTLHHGRFAPQDRRLLDVAIEAGFGKGRPEGSGLVAIGTQTLEISLDCDADLMITDLAPMDVLLQRFGRLHRHAGRSRPAGFEAARVVVLVPARRDLTPLWQWTTPNRNGLGPFRDGGGVYPAIDIIEATWRLLEPDETGAREIIVPQDNRRLVEMATHDDVRTAIVQACGWGMQAAGIEGKGIHERTLARQHALDMAIPFSGLKFVDAEEKIATRLGANDWRIELPEAPMGPFGQQVTAITLPGWQMTGAVPEETPPRIVPAEGGFYLQIAEKTFFYNRMGLDVI